jgi:hypothetical protein
VALARLASKGKLKPFFTRPDREHGEAAAQLYEAFGLN